MTSAVARRLGALVALLAFTASTGCAARFSGGQLPPVETAPPSSGAPAILTYWMAGPQSSLLREVLEESGYFASVEPEAPAVPPGPRRHLHLDVRLMHSSGTQNATRVLLHQIACGITLTAIPYWGTDDTRLVAHVRSDDGLEREYVIEDRMTLVAWLPMAAVQIPRMALEPFIGSVEERFYRNLFRNLVARMSADGLLRSGA